MIDIQTEGGTLELRIHGKVDRHDLTATRVAIDEAVEQRGEAPMLLWFDDFEGYASPQALLDDLRLTAAHRRHIPKLALIGAPKWTRPFLHAFGKLSGTEVREFSVDDRAEARSWITENRTNLGSGAHTPAPPG